MEDAGEDETIRDKDGETGHNDIDAHHNEKYQITDVVIVQEGSLGEMKKTASKHKHFKATQVVPYKRELH